MARLFDAVSGFQARGASFLYISHFIREVFEICDTATVMRDGRVVLTDSVADLDETTIITAMAGQTVSARTRRQQTAEKGPVRAHIDSLVLEGAFSALDLELRGGAVVGIAGSLRSGATAVGRVVAGLEKSTGGRHRSRWRTDALLQCSAGRFQRHQLCAPGPEGGGHCADHERGRKHHPLGAG